MLSLAQQEGDREKMKKIQCGILICLCLCIVSSVQVQAYDIQIQETDSGNIYTLTYEETVQGQVRDEELQETLEVDGQEYHLVSADITYQYKNYNESIRMGTISNTISISSNDTAQIPRYRLDGDTLYILDEQSIQLHPVGSSDETGADVVQIEKIYEGLPDNDMVRLPITVTQDNTTYSLQTVDYEATSYDTYGLPSTYRAVCTYAGLQTYNVSQTSAWEAVVSYQGYRTGEYIQSSYIQYVYEYVDAKEEEEVPPEPEITITPEIPSEKKGNHGKVIAAAATGGAFIAVIGYVFLLTAPVYGALASGKGYKYIGRVRIKRKKDHYAAAMNNFLIEKAEVDNYKIKPPKRILKRSEIGVLEIKCPDGSTLYPNLQQEVTFTIHE